MSTPSPSPHDQLWDEFLNSRSNDARNQLVLAYEPLLHRAAQNVRKRMPPNVEVDDLAASGMFGLLDAIDKFDPDQNVPFESYAYTRIHGSIIDELRQLDWTPRSVRSQARELAKVEESIRQYQQREPTEEEIAGALEWTSGKVSKVKDQTRKGRFESLDEQPVEHAPSPRHTLHDMAFDWPEVATLRTETNIQLDEAIAALNDREEAIIVLYYHEDMTLQQIGTLLNVTESRICQIHRDALTRLQRNLTKRDVDTAEDAA